MYKKNGELYWQETTASFLRDENGKATGILFVGRDITARKQAEKDLQAARDQLLQAEKLSAIGQLSAGVAHEILNPLNIISLELQLIQEMKHLPRDVSEELNICMAQIDRIVAIADGLMRLARVSDKKMETTQINDLVAGILALHKAQLMIDKIERSSATRRLAGNSHGPKKNRAGHPEPDCQRPGCHGRQGKQNPADCDRLGKQ
jgi:two-component system NtrC family sensor kinase